MNSKRERELGDDLVVTRAIAFVYSKRGCLFSLEAKCCHSKQIKKKKGTKNVAIPGADVCVRQNTRIYPT